MKWTEWDLQQPLYDMLGNPFKPGSEAKYIRIDRPGSYVFPHEIESDKLPQTTFTLLNETRQWLPYFADHKTGRRFGCMISMSPNSTVTVRIEEKTFLERPLAIKFPLYLVASVESYDRPKVHTVPVRVPSDSDRRTVNVILFVLCLILIVLIVRLVGK